MEDNNEPLEVLPPSAIMALERAQIDTQVATAHQYPRSLEQFKKRALSMATLDEETAESCIYCRNVGKEQNDKGEWVTKFAEGASIRLAEIVAASYGNIRVAARIVEQTERFVRCEGVAHDLESNYAGKSECMESTVNKKGQPYSERQRALTAKVCLSKAYRDACLKVVPRALCKPILEAAKKVATGQGKPLEERRKKARAWVTSLKIDENRVLAVLGVKGWSDVLDDHLTKLTGLRTSIADNDETIDGAFPPLEGQQSQQSSHKPTQTAHTQATQGTSTTQTSTATATDKKVEEKKPETKAEGPGQGDDNVSFENASSETLKTPSETPGPEKASVTPSAPENASQSQPDAGKATSEPTQQDSLFFPKEGDSDALASVKIVALRAGVSMNWLMGFLRDKKLAREDQKLADLSEKKLLDIAKYMPGWANEIKGGTK